jgi:hypothetical protein
MALREEEVISLAIAQMDWLLGGARHQDARELGDELLGQYGEKPALLKAAGYAAFLDEEGDGPLKSIEFFERDRKAKPTDAEACFWAGWAAMACGVTDPCIDHGAGLLSVLAESRAASRYVAYACAKHPSRETEWQMYEKWIDRGFETLPNLVALWVAKIRVTSCASRQQDLFRQLKTLTPFHDYTEIRAMGCYVADVIAEDAWLEKWETLDDLLLVRPPVGWEK